MQTRSIRDEEELRTLVDLAARLQEHPETHIAYLAVDGEGIAGELAESTWRDVSAVALDGTSVAGWLIGDVEPSMGRVWWFGPFVVADAWESVATDLLVACRDQLGTEVTEEEMAVDTRFGRCRSWAPGHGFVEEEGSFALVLEQPIEGPSIEIREIGGADLDVVAELHDQLFPGTHTTGRDLVDGHDETHRRLVVDVDGTPAGYIAVERQADGSGYIDYVGVAPAMRRRGLGAELVRAGVVELHRIGSTSIGLTVRENSAGARELYTSLGFREERSLVPLRRGFSLD
jgi:ribosomal protein S18 acetylase RimI-like enzyme